MIVLRKSLVEGKMIPKYYGKAYWKFDEHICIYYIIPFNFIAKFIHWFFWKMKSPETKLNEYQKGHRDGYLEGCNHAKDFYETIGYEKGIVIGFQSGIDFAINKSKEIINKEKN